MTMLVRNLGSTKITMLDQRVVMRINDKLLSLESEFMIFSNGYCWMIVSRDRSATVPAERFRPLAIVQSPNELQEWIDSNWSTAIDAKPKPVIFED